MLKRFESIDTFLVEKVAQPFFDWLSERTTLSNYAYAQICSFAACGGVWGFYAFSRGHVSLMQVAVYTVIALNALSSSVAAEVYERLASKHAISFFRPFMPWGVMRILQLIGITLSALCAFIGFLGVVASIWPPAFGSVSPATWCSFGASVLGAISCYAVACRKRPPGMRRPTYAFDGQKAK